MEVLKKKLLLACSTWLLIFQLTTPKQEKTCISSWFSDQAYYAILTKSGKPSQDTYKKIEKTWKSATPSKSVPLVPVERENCSEEDKNSESNETEDETTITETFKELSTQQSSTSVDHEKSLNGSSTIKSTKEEKPRESVNTTNISEETTSSTLIPALSSHLTESSAIVGKNNTGKPNMRTKSGTIMISSSFLTVMSFILFLIINVWKYLRNKITTNGFYQFILNEQTHWNEFTLTWRHKRSHHIHTEGF